MGQGVLPERKFTQRRGDESRRGEKSEDENEMICLSAAQGKEMIGIKLKWRTKKFLNKEKLYRSERQ